MKKIVVLGNSISAALVIKQIRQFDKDSQISLISGDGYLPYQRDLFPQYLADEIKEEGVFTLSEKELKALNVELLLDVQVTRVNLARKKVHAEGRRQFDFDVLILTAMPGYKLPNIRGNNKSGLYDIYSLKSVGEIKTRLPLVDDVVIQAEDFLSLRMALIAAKKGAEIRVVAPADCLFWRAMDEDALSILSDVFAEHNILMHLRTNVVEALGDSECRAVRLGNQKVLSSDMVLFSQIHPDMRILSEGEWEKEIPVDEYFQTSVESVYALGDLTDRNRKNFSYCEVGEENIYAAHAVANHICCQETEVKKIVACDSLKCEGLFLTVMGDLRTSKSIQKYVQTQTEEKKWAELFIKEDCVVGAVLINREDLRDQVLTLIQNQTAYSENINLFDGFSLKKESVDKNNHDKSQLEEVAPDHVEQA